MVEAFDALELDGHRDVLFVDDDETDVELALALR